MQQSDAYKTTELEVASFLRARGHRLIGASPSGRLAEFVFDNDAAPDVDAYIEGVPISALDLFEARRSLRAIIQHVQQVSQNGAEHEPAEATLASGGAEPGGTHAIGERVTVNLVTTEITPNRTDTELHIRFNERNPEHVWQAKELTADMFHTLRQMGARAAIDSGNFIERYTEYADVTEAPRLMHTVVAVQLVATLLNRKNVVFKNGADTIPLDLWAVTDEGGVMEEVAEVGTAAVRKSVTLTYSFAEARGVALTRVVLHSPKIPRGGGSRRQSGLAGHHFLRHLQPAHFGPIF